jgi:uncharacterized protein YoxC
MIDQTNDNQCPLEPWAKLHPKNKKSKRTIMNIFKQLWKKLWSKTEIDEKVVAAAQETKRRAERVVEELKDVGKAVKEVANQAGDVADAVKGKKRRGRPAKKSTTAKKPVAKKPTAKKNTRRRPAPKKNTKK